MALLKRCTLTAVAAAALLVPAAPAAAYSESCGTKYVDGTLLGMPMRLGTDAPTSSQYRVCLRVGNVEGGAITVTAAGGSVGIPSVDSFSTACSASGGPTYSDLTVVGQRLLLATYGNSSETWICIGVGAVGARIVLRGASVGIPSVRYDRDTDLGGPPSTEPCTVAPQACEPIEPLDCTANPTALVCRVIAVLEDPCTNSRICQWIEDPCSIRPDICAT